MNDKVPTMEQIERMQNAVELFSRTCPKCSSTDSENTQTFGYIKVFKCKKCNVTWDVSP